MLTLMLCSVLCWMPTIDGQRQFDTYIEADLPYCLGLSVPPPSIADITVIQDTILWQGISQGTFDICTITSYEPVLLYGDGLLQYEIVPEPSTGFLFMAGFLYRKMKGNKKCRQH